MRSEVDKKAFLAVAKEVVGKHRYNEMKQYISHSDITVYSHCIQVAYTAYRIAVKYRVQCDHRALIRGALLHDYYLYDWHDPNKGFRWHGFKHHKFALENAGRDFELSQKERNIIYSHMFPLTFWCIPKSKEAWLVTLADKIVATKETLRKYQKQEKPHPVCGYKVERGG
ncbi:MAG: HD domain-containing protein [Ruminococcaceae bacterium]|nr:HD domain-containing protein [Oscillospiraceae bacterium]